MKNNTKLGIILGMIFLSTQIFGQSNESEELKAPRGTETYFDLLLLNTVNTSIHYGEAHTMVKDYAKTARGLQAGVSFQAGITPHFSIASELYYLTKGGTLKSNNPITSGESTFRFNTLEAPMLARFHAGKFYLNAGPSIAYTLRGKLKSEGTSTPISFNESPAGFKRLDAGIHMGGGYRFMIKRKSAALDIRYSHGLTDISNNQEMYNRYVNVSLRISNAWKANPLAKK